MTKIFIDGQAGTTGLMIERRLASMNGLELLSPPAEKRKDLDYRLELVDSADISILCLPDDSARELVASASKKSRIIDASSAFRVNPTWVYGLPELSGFQPAKIASAHRVSNPGCYPTGVILMLRPLLEAGLLPAETEVYVAAQSGYSGGGRAMIEAYEEVGYRQKYPCARPYALNNRHKHMPEMQLYSGFQSILFTPSVAGCSRGMLVQIPMPATRLRGASLSAQGVVECWRESYRKTPAVRVVDSLADRLENGYLNPSSLAGTDHLEMTVCGDSRHLLLTALYDNLGKGAAGAAVQNLNLMLGRSPVAGLTL